MAKKATKEVIEDVTVKKVRRLENAPSRSLVESQSAQEVCGTADAGDSAGKQSYSSEDQALEVLVESIVGKLANNPQEQREMADFLEMILDTDPALRSEVLASVTVRK